MITSELVKQTDAGDIYNYYFENSGGARMTVTNYGATITAIIMPDRDGKMDDVVLGLDSIDNYLAGHSFLGSTAGRYANRIRDGRFTLNGREYRLARNNGDNHLHGGSVGFDKRIWNGEIDGDKLVLSYTSPDGEENYPGTLDVQIAFRLTDGNAADIEYTARTDADTVVNLTNHSYFNLNGQGPEVTDHVLTLDADEYTPVDSGLIPTGEIASVEGTPLDFRTLRRVGDGEADSFLAASGGYDNNLVLNGSGFRKCGELNDPASGRRMEFYTDQPAVQVYTGQGMGGGFVGKNGRKYGKYCGICLEAQRFPDSPNHADFPSAVLKPGETYTHHTRYVFSTDK